MVYLMVEVFWEYICLVVGSLSFKKNYNKYQFHFRKIGIDNRKKGKKSEQKLKGIFYK